MSKKSITRQYLETETPDNEINFSDIPETDETFWKNAKVVWPKKKENISIRLDTDILSFFKSQGRGYQTKINAVLRSYIKNQGV